MITTTNGETFTDFDHQALARLVYKRFGRDKEAFCAAWRRMLQNNAEDTEILRLFREDGHQRRLLEQDIRRHGTVEVRDIKLELLDDRSCEILRRHLQRVERRGEQAGQRKQFRQPWRRP